MNTKPNMILGVIVLATTLGFSSTGFAQNTSVTDSSSQTVHYGDLNLSTAKGVQALYVRIRSAALMQCGLVVAAPFYADVRCAKAAVDAAVREVNNADLTALHNRTKSSALIAAR